MRFAFISEYASEHSITLMCAVLKVSRSGYYRFQRHLMSAHAKADVRLLEEIRLVHHESRGTYGSPRMHQELNKRGHACGRHRVARLMAKEGIVGKARRRYRTTTKQNPGAKAAPDLLQRTFNALHPHHIWTSDITYIWTEEGWLYLAVVLDVFSRAIVGWATSALINADLVCTAFERAVWQYRPESWVIVHSDRGSQYTSRKFRSLLSVQDQYFIQSNGRSCYDNAVTETIFHTLKTESLNDERFLTRDEARQHLFDYIERFYNNNRLHSSLGYHTPREMLLGLINNIAA
jgi:transposase InsO family protein